ncbi:MAG: hypothetical protein ACXWL2_02090 [Candidatus Chromulinivorax sp.]
MYSIIVSVLLLLGSYVYPSYLYIGVFLWIVPLLINKKTYTSLHGFIWGLLFFSGHLVWFAALIIQEQIVLGIFVFTLCVVYFSIYAAFWFWFKNQLCRYVQKYISIKRNEVAVCLTWVISTVTFLYLICYCSLAIFGCFEGYCFANPLIPLIFIPWYIQPIYFFGTIWYWINIILINYIIAQLIMIKQKQYVFLLVIAFFWPLLCNVREYSNFMNLDDFIYVQPTWKKQTHTTAQMFYAISKKLNEIAQKNSNVKYIVFPESSFSDNLSLWQEHLSAWTENFSEETSLFIGAFRQNKTNLYNSLYEIKDGIIVNSYDKKHRMPYIERATWLDSINFFEKERIYFSKEQKEQDQEFDHFQPCICSELFCEIKKPQSTKPILFVCNDSWLYFDYMKNLAKYYVQLYGWRYKVPIVYVGYQGLYIL